MEYTPEMIDTLSIQLRNVLKMAEGVPEKVLSKASEFTDSLDEWSDELKKANDGK